MHFGKRQVLALAAGAVAISAIGTVAVAAVNRPVWVSGDMHTHTFLTDGSNTQAQVLKHAFQDYGLDWMANSEHGGTSSRDPFGNTLPAPLYRWQTLAAQSYPLVRDFREIYADKAIIQGVEWNVPTHEHGSVGIVADEPDAVAKFEYAFDQGDNSTSSPYSVMVSKDNTTAAGALHGIAWLQANYPTTSYVAINHPSRKLKNTAADFRDFMAAGPDVFIGLEGKPGHQKEPGRGGYDNGFAMPEQVAEARTYGGADSIVAKVGGVWDSLLGDGLRVKTFADSDFHNTGGDFWPGQYERNVTAVKANTPQGVVDGLKSGRSFMVHGDLIDTLSFTASANGKSVSMGNDALFVKKGADVVVNVKYHSPKTNYNGDRPVVDHFDLIAGEVHAPAVKGTPEYGSTANPTTRVIRRFTRSSVKNLGRGWYSATYVLKDVDGPLYLRLRGTNLAVNTPSQVDAAGNPIIDSAIGANNPEEAWKDLWFYSNPLWISVK